MHHNTPLLNSYLLTLWRTRVRSQDPPKKVGRVCLYSQRWGGWEKKRGFPGVSWPVSLACWVSSKPVRADSTRLVTGEGVHWSCASADSSACSRAHNNKALRIKIKKRRGRKEGKSGFSDGTMEQACNPSVRQKAEEKKKEREVQSQSGSRGTGPQPTHYSVLVPRHTLAILALGKRKPEDPKLKAGLGYTLSSRPVS